MAGIPPKTHPQSTIGPGGSNTPTIKRPPLPTPTTTHTPFDEPPPVPKEREKDSCVSLSGIMDGKNEYPLSVKVVSGMYGQQSATSLYQEKILLLFEMRLKVIEALVEKGGTYQIPLCTANKFSVLHNPSDNMAQAMMGHYYESVGHILAQHHKPKVICATKSFKGSSQNGSVNHGDVMIIQKIQKRSIKCLNVLTNEERKLHESCAGAFTTQPDQIKMSLRDICSNIDLPVKVIMHHQLPRIVLVKGTVVTLLSQKWEQSVIATRKKECSTPHSLPSAINGEPPGAKAMQVMRLTKEVGINFVMDRESKTDQVTVYHDELNKSTRDVYERFDYTTIKLHLFNEDPVWPNHEEIQSSLYCHVEQQTNWDQIIDKKKPDKAFKGRRATVKKPGPNQFPSSAEGVSDGELEDDPSVIPDSATILHTVNTVNRQMMIEVEKVRAEVEGFKMELRQTKLKLIRINQDLPSMIRDVVRAELKQQLEQQMLQNSTADKTVENVYINLENVEILKGLSHEQVLQMLYKLNLSRCIPAFKQKKIKGADIVNFDETKLEVELGVDSKLDVLRLMKVIQGCPSVWKVLEGES